MLRKALYSIFLFVFVTTAAYSEKKPVRVYADITGDLLHTGHIEFFKKARALGDYLVIGVLSDETVASYKRVPIMSLKERVALVEACKYVDEVIPGVPLRTTKEWIKEHKIDLVVHGDDFDEKTLKDQYSVPLELGIMRIVPYTKGVSTTEIIQRVNGR